MAADRLTQLRDMVEAALSELFTKDAPYRILTESMRYSLLAGGKRLRPVLTLKFCESLGGDIEAAMPVACALELIHTYSLIHDDLPAMDDDDLRRGMPTNHIVYGEGRAVIAGDALQAGAFELCAGASLPPERVVRCVRYLAAAAGADGMCGGQELDTDEGSDKSLEGLGIINDLKTGALIRAACVLGVICAGGDEGAVAAAERYGTHLARAFQIRDDILDITSTPEELGKTIGSDEANDKPTYASILGVEAAEELVKRETALAVAAVVGKFEDGGVLADLAEELSERKT